MILPSSYLICIILLAACMFCQGSWANMFKAAGKWRFELFCLDFAVGALLTATIVAATFGSMGWDGFSLIDDLRLAGKRQELFAFLAGAVFNLGNMLLVGAIALGGMSVAFPAGLGTALIVSVIWRCLLTPIVNPVLLAAGCIAVATAIVLSAIAFKNYRMQRLMAQIREGKTKSTKKTVSTKAIAVAVTGGMLLGSFAPCLDLARSSEIGLGPYSLGLIFALGVFFTTFIYDLFLMNMPLLGAPLDFGQYFQGSAKQHLLGLAAGGLLITGTIAAFVAAKAEGAAQVSAAVLFGFPQGVALIGTLWGLLYWREFRGAEPKVRTLAIAMVVLLALGIGIVSVAPVYGLH